MDQEAALNQELGKYGFFYGSYFTYYTPEQDAQLSQITEEHPILQQILQGIRDLRIEGLNLLM